MFQTIKRPLIFMKLFFIRAINRLRFALFRNALPKNKDGKVYVNIGPEDLTSAEFINIDSIPFWFSHYVQDASRLSVLPDESVDMLYACHVVEHLPRKDLTRVLKEWARVIKKGGIFRFAVPDFDQLIEIYTLSGRNTESIVNQLMGQDGQYDDHHTIWNRSYAEKVLREAGFREVRVWDPRTAEHHAFKDKSSRVMEVPGKHVPISLNLETVK